MLMFACKSVAQAREEREADSLIAQELAVVRAEAAAKAAEIEAAKAHKEVARLLQSVVSKKAAAEAADATVKAAMAAVLTGQVKKTEVLVSNDEIQALHLELRAMQVRIDADEKEKTEALSAIRGMVEQFAQLQAHMTGKGFLEEVMTGITEGLKAVITEPVVEPVEPVLTYSQGSMRYRKGKSTKDFKDLETLIK
jgi:hypothetical protein